MPVTCSKSNVRKPMAYDGSLKKKELEETRRGKKNWTKFTNEKNRYSRSKKDLQDALVSFHISDIF